MATKQLNKDQKRKLEETDVALREKYLQIVQSLIQNERKRFNEAKYKKLVIPEMVELLPGIDRKVIDDTAHYISSTFNNEAGCLREHKSRLHRKKQQNGHKLCKNSIVERQSK